jgi:hypothetical protein
MASYWIIVPSGNADLYDLLSIAFRGRAGFSVIMDRRAPEIARTVSDRRAPRVDVGPDEIIVAERLERMAGDRSSRQPANRATATRLRGRRMGASADGGRQSSSATPVARHQAHRSLTL